MTDQWNQGSKNDKPTPSSKFIVGVAAAFLILIGIIAISLFYQFRPQTPLPTATTDPTKIVLEIEAISMSIFITQQAAQLPQSVDATKAALEIDATAMRNFLTFQAATLWPSTPLAPTALTPDPLSVSAMPLFTNENEGYILRYPPEYHVVLYGRSICFTPAYTNGAPGACHVANANFTISDANGRTLTDAADELVAVANPEIEVTRTAIKIGGKDAILLDNIYSYDVLRQLVVIHKDSLYTFTFSPWSEGVGVEEFQKIQRLYATITESFTFLNNP